MAIVQLDPFDLLTAPPAQLMAPAGLWAGLTRLTTDGTGTARLLLVADNLRPADVLASFQERAVPTHRLPRALGWYKTEYEEFLERAVHVTRHMRVYLIMDAVVGEVGLLQLLSTYAMRAYPLGATGIPLPFLRGEVKWNRLHDEAGGVWATVQSRRQQSGILHPRSLHRLFSLDFPVWCSLEIATHSQQQAQQLLRTKDASARFERSTTTEAQANARTVRGTVEQLMAEMNQLGSALHQVSLTVLVGAEDESTLQQRLEVVRGATGLEMEGWERHARGIGTMFSPEPPRGVQGQLIPSHGLALLTGSALAYRRRTVTRGIYLGTDVNQAPVILDVFDPRHDSYNMVVLGRTGSGKTFAMLLLMLRHLLMGVRLIVIDPQGNIDLSWLGRDLYHRAVLGTPEAAINILDITHEDLAQQVSSVMAMLSMLGVVDRSQRLEVALMDQVLMDIYVPIWGRVAPTEVPTLRAVQRRLEDLAADEGLDPELRLTATHLGFVLEQYTTGSRQELFGHRTTVDFRLDHAVTVFDTSRLPKRGDKHDNLRAALLSILVADVNQAIRRKRRADEWTPILFLIDEMGILMRDAVIAAHVSEEFKTARSRFVGVIAIDQDLHSFLGPADESGLHHGVPMIANSATTLIFKQKASELARVREHFPDLPEAMVAALPIVDRGVCIASLPDDLLQMRVIPSALEKVLLSSAATDRAIAQDLMAQIHRETQGAEAA